MSPWLGGTTRSLTSGGVTLPREGPATLRERSHTADATSSSVRMRAPSSRHRLRPTDRERLLPNGTSIERPGSIFETTDLHRVPTRAPTPRLGTSLFRQRAPSSRHRPPSNPQGTTSPERDRRRAIQGAPSKQQTSTRSRQGLQRRAQASRCSHSEYRRLDTALHRTDRERLRQNGTSVERSGSIFRSNTLPQPPDRDRQRRVREPHRSNSAHHRVDSACRRPNREQLRATRNLHCPTSEHLRAITVLQSPIRDPQRRLGTFGSPLKTGLHGGWVLR